LNEVIYKAKRFLSRSVARSMLPVLDQSIVTFGFDDCPASAIENALPMLEAEGWRATIYVACGLCETENHLGRHMSLSDIKNVHDRGHEIAGHTFSHVSSNDVTTENYLAESSQDANLLNATRVYSGKDLKTAIKAISQAKSEPYWLHLFTHDVRENPSIYGCTPNEFQSVVAAVKATGLPVLTVDTAYRMILKRRLTA